MKHPSAPLPHRHALRANGILLALALLLAAPASQAQSGEPPMGRAAWLSLAQGNVQLAPSDTRQWGSSETNRPLAQGDQLATRAGARAELHVGSTALRLQGDSMLEFTRLDDYATQVKLTQGSLGLHLRELAPGERVEIDTPNLAFVAHQPGVYRFDVDPQSGTTRVAVHSGAGTIYGANAESYELSAGRQAVFAERNLLPVAGTGAAWRDEFDRWSASRSQQDELSVSARYVSRELTGYQQLDAYGDWSNDTTYGAVWFPRSVAIDWAPYRDGQWRWVAPWGWTWVDNAPWGFAPSHYGRWAQFGGRWGWVPGPRHQRPVFGPGHVDFNGPGHRPDRPGSNWRPLRPGEAAPPAGRVTLPLRPEPVRPSHLSPTRPPSGQITLPMRPEPVRPGHGLPERDQTEGARPWVRPPASVEIPRGGNFSMPPIDAPRQGNWGQTPARERDFPRSNDPGLGTPFRPQRPTQIERPAAVERPQVTPLPAPYQPARPTQQQRPEPSFAPARGGSTEPESAPQSGKARFGQPRP